MYTYMYKCIFTVGLFITSNPCHRVCQETLSRQCSTQVSSVFCYCWLNKDTLVFHDVFLMNKLVDLFVTGTLIMYPCFHGALSIVAMVSKGSVHVCSYICPDWSRSTYHFIVCCCHTICINILCVPCSIHVRVHILCIECTCFCFFCDIVFCYDCCFS